MPLHGNSLGAPGTPTSARAAVPVASAAAPGTVSRLRLGAARDLPARIADLVLDQAGGPDASGATLIVPGLRAAPGLRRAFGLAAAARGHVLCLPPRMMTAQDLLVEALPGQTIEAAVRRAERLYAMVRAHGWYQQESLWDTCSAVIALADELGETHAAALPEGEWQRAIRAAYKRGAAHADSREAALVWEVWQAETLGASATSGAIGLPGSIGAPGEDLADPLAPTVFMALALRSLGNKPAGPLFVLLSGTLAQGWMHALQRYAVQAAVTLIEPVPPPWSARVWRDVRTAAGEPAGEQAGEAAAVDAQAALAADVAKRTDLPLALPPLAIYAADSLEAEAQAVATQVCAWLAQGLRDIALVAFDTLVARRARALLERRRVLLADEAGWRLSTTSAATAVMRWVEAVADGMPSRTVLDWLKSPFVLGDLDTTLRADAVAAIEDAVQQHNITHVSAALLQGADLPPAAAALSVRLLAAQQAWPRGEQSFGTWINALDATLDTLGVRAPLAADPAGVEVLALLAQLKAALAPAAAAGRSPDRSRNSARNRVRNSATHTVGLRASLAEWRIFLSAQFEGASFRNRLIDSPVVLTTLEAAQWRGFDAVLLIGAGAAHLNAAVPDDLFVNTALRSALGLADVGARRDQLHHRLACLIAMSGAVAATWRRRNLDQAQPLGTPLARLELARRLAGQPSAVVMFEAAQWHSTAAPPPAPSTIAETGMKHLSQQAEATVSAPGGIDASASRHGAGTVQPAPQMPGGLPARVSVSAWASLLACPYRFFATALLGLREPEQLEEELSKRDYGIWVHRVLTRFHQQHLQLREVEDAVLIAALTQITGEVFAPLIAFNYLSLGWQLRLSKLFPAYLAWQREREAQGWMFEAGEAERMLVFAVNTPRTGLDRDLTPRAGPQRDITLAGRVDRIDRRAEDGSVALLDYKTQSLSALKRRLRDAGEEAQLAAYLLFEESLGNRVDQTALVSVDGDVVELAGTVIDGVAERARAQHLLQAIENGAALPANGTQRTCDFCQARGLCRKDYWSVA